MYLLKKLVFPVIVSALLLTCYGQGFAALKEIPIRTKEASISLKIGSNIANVNGEEKTLNSSPVIFIGRTLVPIRFLVEELGGSIAWENGTKRIDILLEGRKLSLWVDKNKAEINGKSIDIEIAPKIIKERTYLPFRFVAENLGCEVDWQATEKIITLKRTPISIPDKNLEASICKAMELQPGTLTKGMALWLSDLNASQKDITNLSGLEYFANLKSLDISNNMIEDFSQLGGLRELENLNISNSQIDNPEKNNAEKDKTTQSVTQDNSKNLGNKANTLAFLDNLEKLKGLNANKIGISDIGSGKKFKNIENLLLENNLIKNISELAEVESLKSLSLRGNSVADCSPIKRNLQLTTLDLSNDVIAGKIVSSNGVLDNTTLEGFKNLEFLNLSATGVSSIDFVSKMPKIATLNLFKNQISDLSPIRNCTKLSSLIFPSNHVSNLEPLASLKELQILIIFENDISDFSVLSGLDKLKALSIDHNNIGDLASIKKLESLKNLKELSLWGLSDPKEVFSMVNTIDEKADGIMRNIINPNMSELDKEVVIHDYIATNVTYEYDYEKFPVTDPIHTPIGVLLNKKAVCDGYSQTLNILYSKAGIESKLLLNDAIQNNKFIGHAWNIVKINGAFYHVDLTWDDNDKGKIPAKFYFPVSHEYLNIADNILSSNHVMDRFQDGKCNISMEKTQAGFMKDYAVTDTCTFFRTTEGISVKLPGKNPTEVTKDNSLFFAAYGNTLFYTNADDSNKLYSIQGDGSSRKSITENASLFATYSNGKIYYLEYNKSEGTTILYSLNPNNFEKTKLVESHLITCFTIYNNNIIYFKALNENNNQGRLFQCELNGGSLREASNENISGFTVNGTSVQFDFSQNIFAHKGYVYFQSASNNNYLYRLNITTNSVTQVTSIGAEPVEFFEDYIYFKNQDKFYRIKTDGTNQQELTE